MKHFWAAAYPTDVAAMRTLVTQQVATADQLTERLTQIHDLIVNDSLANYQIDQLRGSARAVLHEVFAFRMLLHDQIPRWHAEKLLVPQAQHLLRSIMREARYGADMMGELAIGNAILAEGEEPFAGFTGSHDNTLVHPKFANANTSTEIDAGGDGAKSLAATTNGAVNTSTSKTVHAGDIGSSVSFRSGDVLLVRGRRHNSAAIARIGDVDSQFSHVGMVYIDGAGKQWMVEALIEDGAVVNPLEYSLKHGISRAVVLRHQDSELAHRAAQFIHDRVRRSHRPYRRHIPYDFTMRLNGYRELYCAKLVRQAFDQASNGAQLLPTFKTRLDMKNRDFVDRIGVRTIETFAPADLEIQPEFDIVAEWRDYRVTSNSRLQDLIMDKLFEWMDEREYRFKPDFSIKLIGMFGRLSSYLSENAKDLIVSVVPKVPRNMSRKAIGAVAMLHRSAQPVFTELQLLERRSVAQAGFPLPMNEVRRLLEAIRATSPGQIGYLVSAADKAASAHKRSA